MKICRNVLCLCFLVYMAFPLISFGQTHVKVMYEAGKYGGWPANWGMWNWGNEILVGYSYADHKNIEGHGHAYDRKSSLAKFSRSLDGGVTWTMEDAYEHGITEATWEHNLGAKSKAATKLAEPIDFKHPDFAFTFRTQSELDGRTSFYYTYDKGKHWNGPYALLVDFEGATPAGIVSRTSYIVEGKHAMVAFLTVGFRDKRRDWRQVACVRTDDGGKTWKHLSWIGPPQINSIMPAAVKLKSGKLLTIIRRTNPPMMVAFESTDGGKTWTQLNDPVKVDANGHPPALVALNDGRLCLVYGIREASTMDDGIGMYVTYSSDDGKSWETPVLLRGKDGAVWDIGYPRAVLLPDGNIVATYYYNNVNWGDSYRYISATIFDPKRGK